MPVFQDPQSLDNRQLSSIARNPSHPMHTHAKAELDRRKMTKEGAMKRIATTQASKTDRMASTDKKGLETFKKKPTTEEKDPEEYDNEGSMMKSQLRQICSANEKLMSMVKDDDNLPEWVQAKVTKATDYIRSVRDYLESEKMEEKTLTPAELKKREKIAKAIERDSPDMPMDKKMAIATATAKRVAEGLNEGSYERSAYGKGHVYDRGEAHEDAARHHDMEAEKHEKARNFETADLHTAASKAHQKAADYFSRLHSKREKGGGTGIVSTVSSRAAHDASQKANSFKEDTDLTELKTSTLVSYIKKASDWRAKNAYDIGKSGKINYKGLKRRQGINRAVNKIANEENIDEVLDTPQAMQSYKDKAKYSKDRAANSAAAKILRGRDADGNRADHSPELKTMDKRTAGLKMVDRNAMRKTRKALTRSESTLTRIKKILDK